MHNFDNLVSGFNYNVNLHPDKVACFDYDENTSWTWKDLENFSKNLSYQIKVKTNDPRVCIVFTRQTATLPAFYVGCWASGCSVLPGSLKWTQNEFLEIRNRFLKTNQQLLIIIEKELNKDISWFGDGFDILVVESKKNLLAPNELKIKLENTETVALYLLTSGTTAKPRVLGFDHKTLFEGALVETTFEGYSNTDVLCNLRPHYTSAGLNTLWPFFCARYKLIFSHQIAQAPIWRFIFALIEKTKLKKIIMSPTYISEFLRYNETFNERVNVNLFFGGNPLSEKQIKNLLNIGFKPAMRYGMTEFCRIISKINYFNSKSAFDKSNVGSAAADILLKQTSEGLSIKGAGLFSHSIEEDKLIKHEYERWYQSYDKAKNVDQDGIKLIGRGPTFVSIKGFTFNLIEVENVLRELKSVQDCVILKSDIADKLYAFVLVNDSTSLSLIKDECASKLSEFKRPTIIQVDKWPQAPNGKIDINELRKIINKYS